MQSVSHNWLFVSVAAAHHGLSFSPVIPLNVHVQCIEFATAVAQRRTTAP